MMNQKYIKVNSIILFGAFLFVINISAQKTSRQPKEFIITMWCAPPAHDWNYRILTRDGYNLSQISLSAENKAAGKAAVEALDEASLNGIKLLFYHKLIQPSSLDDVIKKNELNSLIDAIKNNKGLMGYYLSDEPHANSYLDWERLVRYLKERDPKHFAYINLFPVYASREVLEDSKKIKKIANHIDLYKEYLRLFVDVVKVDVISYDHYSFLKGGRNGVQYFQNLSLIRATAATAKVPFINVVQACTIKSDWRLPNENELRMLAYTTMTYGARGISWFLYWGSKEYGGLYQDGVRMPIADKVARINLEIKAYGPELMKLTSTNVYHTTPVPIGCKPIPADCSVKIYGNNFVLGMFMEKDIENTFMITNTDYKKNSLAILSLKMGRGKLLEYSKESFSWVAIQRVEKNSVVKINIIAGGGKLFRFVKSN